MTLIYKSKKRKTEAAILKEKAKLKAKLDKLKKKEEKAAKMKLKECSKKVSRTLSTQLRSLVPSGFQIDNLTNREYNKLIGDFEKKFREIKIHKKKCKNVR